MSPLNKEAIAEEAAAQIGTECIGPTTFNKPFAKVIIRSAIEEATEELRERNKELSEDLDHYSDLFESLPAQPQEWTVETICMLSHHSIVELHNATLK